MKVYLSRPGADFVLDHADKDAILRDGEVKCSLDNSVRGEAVLHVIDEVVDRDMLEEPGFHITAEPLIPIWEAARIDLYLSKTLFHKLVDGKTLMDPGWVVSRGRYDRVHVLYYGADDSKTA